MRMLRRPLACRPPPPAACTLKQARRLAPAARRRVQASAEHARKQQELMREIELRRKMKATVVPTNDGEVRRMLRQLGEPITLFGEREMERRDRLRKMLAGMGEEAAVAALGPPTDEEMAEVEAAAAAPPTTEVFYTEGGPALLAARLDIAQFSLRRAAARLAAARRRRESPDEDDAAEVAAAERQLRTLANQASELGDERPIVGCAFSPDGSQLATGAWSGVVKVWSMPHLTKSLAIKAHAERVTGVAWHPEASTTGAPLWACALGLAVQVQPLLPVHAPASTLAAAACSILLQAAWMLQSRWPAAPPTPPPSCGRATAGCCARWKGTETGWAASRSTPWAGT